MFQRDSSLPQGRGPVGVIDTCGREFLDDLEKCRTNPFWCLSDVARKYGISRERVRQLHKRIYKEPYNPRRRSLTKEKNTDLSCSNDPRNKVNSFPSGSQQEQGAQAEKEFLRRCEAKGLSVEIPCDSSVDLIVNGKLVDVKTSNRAKKALPGNKICYLHYGMKGRQINKADFFACYHPIEDSFFIVPNIEWKGRTKPQHIYISNQKSTYFNAKNRHWEYQDRYDLLESQPQ